MIQEFVLEVIKDISFYERIETKKGIIKRYRQESNFFKLRRKTLKGLQKEIDSILKNYLESTVDWKVYTSFPFE